ncbi:hypothetical protein ZHAS_00007182 [Anopheles sinensis]|uniref:Uncharacterized protein n=1 Tax=Anopheles sinensis TaxID=74873 RepID=A0A084VPC0_ANOSI|nr:hypothetical protein ZHAS_00007182 [Anopheles sinensis]
MSGPVKMLQTSYSDLGPDRDGPDLRDLVECCGRWHHRSLARHGEVRRRNNTSHPKPKDRSGRRR